jgi:hypothetical protein
MTVCYLGNHIMPHRNYFFLTRKRDFALLSFILISWLHVHSQGLFDSDGLFEFTLHGDIKELLKDRIGEPRYFPVGITYLDEAGKRVELEANAKTRGHFRRMKENCSMPPLLLNFSDKSTTHTQFLQQSKVKLVLPCQGEKYVPREYMVYQLYRLFTPQSFRARLVKVTFDDREKGMQDPVFGILIEEERQVAERNHLVAVEGKLVRPEQTRQPDFLLMSVFQYMIGNTDWSIQYLQNIKLFATDSMAAPVPVPYDFDHAGVVAAPYAKPAEQLMMTSVRERRYRGYCIADMKLLEPVFSQFQLLKDSIYSLYRDSPWIDEAYKKSTLKYFDAFYETIGDPKRATKEFTYPCQKDGTGNVVIKGLRN